MSPKRVFTARAVQTAAAVCTARAEPAPAGAGNLTLKGDMLVSSEPSHFLSTQSGQLQPGGRLARVDRQAWALTHLHSRGPLSPATYARALAVSSNTALCDLRDLVDRGLVRAEGTTQDRRYVLAGESGL